MLACRSLFGLRGRKREFNVNMARLVHNSLVVPLLWRRRLVYNFSWLLTPDFCCAKDAANFWLPSRASTLARRVAPDQLWGSSTHFDRRVSRERVLSRQISHPKGVVLWSSKRQNVRTWGSVDSTGLLSCFASEHCTRHIYQTTPPFLLRFGIGPIGRRVPRPSIHLPSRSLRINRFAPCQLDR